MGVLVGVAVGRLVGVGVLVSRGVGVRVGVGEGAVVISMYIPLADSLDANFVSSFSDWSICKERNPPALLLTAVVISTVIHTFPFTAEKLVMKDPAGGRLFQVSVPSCHVEVVV